MDIFDFVKQEEAAYSLPITVIDGWEWSMKEHIRLSTLYKNSQFSQGNGAKERDNKPFKNIVRPLLNLQYRAEGFDVKDITLYINDSEEYFKSFLIKKYHDQWANENEIDTFIDDMCESYIDYGGALIRDVNQKKPENIPLASLAFADQTNILSGPIGIKHFFSPSELQKYSAVGWGDPKNGATITIEEAIILAKSEKIPDAQDGKHNRTPGKYIECYEVNGVFPESWLYKGGNEDKYIRQMHILMFYKNEKGKKQGLTLFAGRAADDEFKMIMRDKIHGRALGFGGVEELFDAQVWANYDEIVMKEMLDSASKIILKTTDPALAAKHPKGLAELDNLSLLELENGTDVGQVSTTPVNMPLFQQSVTLWEAHAKEMASATGATTGISPGSRTSFNALSLLTQQGLALHDYRKGKLATFTGGVWRDWVIPQLAKDIVNGKKFLAELSLDELQKVAQSLVDCQVNDIIKEKILNGEVINPSDIDNLKGALRDQFMKKGSKHFLEILKGEFKDAAIEVEVSIVGKQKDLAKMVTELQTITAQIIANPAILNDPRMAQLLNQMIEATGFSPIDFGVIGKVEPAPAAPIAPVIPKQPAMALP